MTRAMDEIVWAVNPKHDTLESLASYYLGSGWREAPGLVLLILALAVRPTGVFGKTAIKKV